MTIPWFKFYPADYLLDPKVDALPLEAQAILVRLWCIVSRDGEIPDDPKMVARRVGVPPQTMRTHWGKLRCFFDELPPNPLPNSRQTSEFDGGFNGIKLTSNRMVLEQTKYKEVIEKRRASGASGGAKRQANARILLQAKINQSETETEEERKRVQDALSAPVPVAPIREKKARVKKQTTPEETNPVRIVEAMPPDWIELFWRLKAGWEKFCSQPRNLTQCALQWRKLHAEDQNLEDIRAAATRYFAQVDEAKAKRPDAIPRDLLVFLNSYSWQGVSRAS